MLSLKRRRIYVWLLGLTNKLVVAFAQSGAVPTLLWVGRAPCTYTAMVADEEASRVCCFARDGRTHVFSVVETATLASAVRLDGDAGDDSETKARCVNFTLLVLRLLFSSRRRNESGWRLSASVFSRPWKLAVPSLFALRWLRCLCIPKSCLSSFRRTGAPPPRLQGPSFRQPPRLQERQEQFWQSSFCAS